MSQDFAGTQNIFTQLLIDHCTSSGLVWFLTESSSIKHCMKKPKENSNCSFSDTTNTHTDLTKIHCLCHLGITAFNCDMSRKEILVLASTQKNDFH